FQNFSLCAAFDLLAQITVGHSGSDSGDFTYLIGQILGHYVDVFRTFFPDTMNTSDLGLTTEYTLGTDLAGDTRHFATKNLKLIHHGVDGPFERGNFGVHFERMNLYLHRKVTVGDLSDDAANFS